ncbi:MAG: DUF523 domain-containing protein [Thiohalomonadales bacterium]
MTTRQIFIGVSSCLLGQHTRYDGGHKKSLAVTETLCQRFSCVSLCPELGIGLGVPRAAIVLITTPSRQLRAIIQESAVDVTRQIQQYAQDNHMQLQQLCGYVLKSKSPSCAIDSAYIYTSVASKSPITARTSDGLFTTELRRQFPYLPICDETELDSEKNTAAFIDRVITYSNTK